MAKKKTIICVVAIARCMCDLNIDTLSDTSK